MPGDDLLTRDFKMIRNSEPDRHRPRLTGAVAVTLALHG
jgi:hypothetical protein